MKFFAYVRLAIVAALATVYLGLASQAVQAQSEAIADWTSEIFVEATGEVYLNEIITYDFGANKRHGIFRELPLKSEGGPMLAVEVLAVTTKANEPVPFVASTADGKVTVKIGDPNNWVSGQRDYIISYRIDNAIRQFEDHLEFYWNVTGNDWTVPILQSRSLVTWPDMAPMPIDGVCYTGGRGSFDQNCTINTSTEWAEFTGTTSLGVGEGQTIVVSFPTGTIKLPVLTSIQETADRNVPGILIAVGLGTFIFATVFVIRFGRSRRLPRALKNRPIIAEYNPPEGLRPIELGAIVDRKVDIADVSSLIMDLAVRGYIRIKYLEQARKLWKNKKDFQLIKHKDGQDLVNQAEILMFNWLFSGREQVLVSELETAKTEFQAVVSKIKKVTETSLFEQQYFDSNSKKMVRIASGVFVLFIVLAAIGVQFFGYVSLGIALLGIFISVFVIVANNNRLSTKGIETLAKILGFKEFLSMTETDRLRLLNAPDLKPEVFEKWLAYAMVLGVEEKWAELFANIYVTNPEWYDNGHSSTRFNSLSFVQQLAVFDNSFNHAFRATMPTSGRSGGFSGGGSGGGGGGSW